MASIEHSSWKEAAAGAVSGALTVLLLHPLDVVKTRLQVQEKGNVRYRGAVHAIYKVTRREGVRGLYAGLTPSLIGSSVSWGLYWLAWKNIRLWHCQQFRVDELPWNWKLLCGMEAGIIVTLLTNPLWVVKTRMQLESTNVVAKPGTNVAALNLFRAVRSIHRREGPRGFYRGLGPALLLCSHGAIQIMAYEEIKQWRKGHLTRQGLTHLPHSDALLVGAAAKLVASTCTYPLQVARSRMQQQLHGTKALAYQTLPKALVSIVQRDGLRGLYQGFTANALRVCPQAGLQFFLYESTRRLLGKLGTAAT